MTTPVRPASRRRSGRALSRLVNQRVQLLGRDGAPRSQGRTQ